MDMKKVQSTCNYCSIACNIDFNVEDNEIVSVVPTQGYPVNIGFCCIKGLNLDKQNTKFPNPVYPLIRGKDGDMEQISWDEAFKVMASKIKELQDKYGRESVAFISTGQLTTEEMALLGHIGRNYLGMNGDGNTRLCMATSVVAHKQSYGLDAPPYTFDDLELSDTLIFIGANPVVAHPILWTRVRNNKNNPKIIVIDDAPPYTFDDLELSDTLIFIGANPVVAHPILWTRVRNNKNNPKIIVIDPRQSETAIRADEWIDIKPKADLRLLYTLANYLIEKDWIDKDYIEKYTEDFEGFKEHVKKYTFKKYTLDDVEEKTGISKGRVEKLAETIHEGKRVSFWWTMGVNQSYQAVRTAQAIINLAIMTGNIGRPGTGANSITGQCNAMGSRLFSNTTGFYGGGDYDNENRRNAISKALDMPEEMLPTKPTIPYDQIIEFWWTMGVNQSYQAVRTAQAIINLAIMTGNIGRPGTGANSITGQCNAMGSRLFSNTTGFYGGGDYDNEDRRKAISKALNMPEEMLPTKPTIPYDQIIERCITGEIKGLWIVATNPIVSWTNSRKFREATEHLEFFVVQDIYDNTESVKMCHH